jgi:hypothetical protein
MKSYVLRKIWQEIPTHFSRTDGSARTATSHISFEISHIGPVSEILFLSLYVSSGFLGALLASIHDRFATEPRYYLKPFACKRKQPAGVKGSISTFQTVYLTRSRSCGHCISYSFRNPRNHSLVVFCSIGFTETRAGTTSLPINLSILQYMSGPRL